MYSTLLMAKNSQIEWTHHTFNPWWGCTKVSPACDHCYAEQWAKRMGKELWGAHAPRRFFSDKHWSEPLVWNEEAQNDRERKRVFCASMADVFERRAELNDYRQKLWEVIKATPWLDWLLLTKRPQNIGMMVPWNNDWPENIWLGTTVENQFWAETRLRFLLKHPAKVRFLSCEPLLGPLNLGPWLKNDALYPINWVIAGGESGHNARPMHPDWPKELLNQCQAADVAFHFKQWGHWVPEELGHNKSPQEVHFKESRPVRMVKLSKKEAGRILDGTTWDGVPVGAAA
jgi:protein gp37